MALKDVINRKQEAANEQTIIQSQSQSSIPIFKIGDFRKKKKKWKWLKVLTLTLVSIIAALAIFIYVPQLFIADVIDNPILATPDADMIKVRNEYLSNNPDLDSDKDGLTNGKEKEIGTDIFNADTDNDGVADGKDSEPKKAGKELLYTLTYDNEIDTDSAYQMNGVILWADNDDAFALGGVIETVSGGYRFCNFKGWAKFPTDKFAYKLENGVHTPLQYRKDEQAWYINGDCEVVFAEKEPEMTYKLTVFGKKSYISGSWGEFCNAILPQKGFITCEDMWLEDTFIDVSSNQFADNRNINFDKSDLSRFGQNDTALTDLATVYAMIDSGNAVLTSLFSQDRGESFVVVYGYTNDGHLLVTDEDGKKDAILSVYPVCSKELKGTKEVGMREWFEFRGCGFDSQNGDTIAFVAGAVEATDDETQKPVETPETTVTPTPDNTPTPIPTSTPNVPPKNGVYQSGSKTYYYIGGVPAVNNCIRLNDGMYEICKVTDDGAFYVDEQGQKVTGKLDLDGKTYIYLDGGFLKNSFFTESVGGYKVCKPTDKNAKYCGNERTIVYGWFMDSNGKRYYASKTTGVIYTECFVKDEKGKVRYLDKNGQFLKNQIFNIHGVAVILDKSGNITNYEYVSNVIKKYIKE